MKKVAQASSQTLKAYENICENLRQFGAESSSMFGMPALKHAKKAFAGLFGDAMVFKLSGDPHRDTLALVGSELFDPSGMKRPMKAWVVVPAQHRSKWPALSQLSFEQMNDIPAGKTAAPSKDKRRKSR